MFYNLKELKEINWSYDQKHNLNMFDVEAVNEAIAQIVSSRDESTPQIGDIVKFTNKYGEYYPSAHIECIRDGQLYICERPYTPFLSIQKQISTSTSGGVWHYIPKNIQFVGVESKEFLIWGHCGPTANGAIRFSVDVNVYEYTEGEHEFTTKTHDKFYLYTNYEENAKYKYELCKDGHTHIAFKTEDEYQAWLITFHGIEDNQKPVAWSNSKIIWTYKQQSKCIPLEEYLAIDNSFIDSELCNGQIQECKRIIDGTSITTYLPFQKDMIILPGEKRYKKAYKSALVHE